MTTTVEQELEELKNQFSDEELQEAEQELEDIVVSLKRQDKIETELTEVVSKHEQLKQAENSIKTAEIINYSIDDIEDPTEFVFTLLLPVTGIEKQISFTQKDIGANKNLQKFLDCIDCTVTDLSNAIYKELPVVYTQYKNNWKIRILYGDSDIVQDVLQNTSDYKYNTDPDSEICKKLTWFDKVLPAIISGGFIGMLQLFNLSQTTKQLTFTLVIAVCMYIVGLALMVIYREQQLQTIVDDLEEL